MPGRVDGVRTPRTRRILIEVTARAAAFVAMMSLAAPPLVGIVCGLLCESGSHHQVAVGPSGHGAAHAAHHPGGSTPVTLVGDHVCDHGLGVVDLFGPSHGQRTPLPQVTAAEMPVPAIAAARPVFTPWGQPLERVLGPPPRSPVLRI